MTLQDTLWWLRDAAAILNQNGTDTHAKHCRNAAELITSLSEENERLKQVAKYEIDVAEAEITGRKALSDTLREIHIIAADAQLRATYQRTALERICDKARAALGEKQ